MPKLYIELIEDNGEDGLKTGFIALWKRCINKAITYIFSVFGPILKQFRALDLYSRLL